MTEWPQMSNRVISSCEWTVVLFPSVFEVASCLVAGICFRISSAVQSVYTESASDCFLSVPLPERLVTEQTASTGELDPVRVAD